MTKIYSVFSWFHNPCKILQRKLSCEGQCLQVWKLLIEKKEFRSYLLNSFHMSNIEGTVIWITSPLLLLVYNVVQKFIYM